MNIVLRHALDFGGRIALKGKSCNGSQHYGVDTLSCLIEFLVELYLKEQSAMAALDWGDLVV
jgi:hypothetical protein